MYDRLLTVQLARAMVSVIGITAPVAARRARQFGAQTVSAGKE